MKKEKNLRKNKNILRVSDDSAEYGMDQILPPVLVLTQTLVLILTLFVQRTYVLSTTERSKSPTHFDLKLENRWA